MAAIAITAIAAGFAGGLAGLTGLKLAAYVAVVVGASLLARVLAPKLDLNRSDTRSTIRSAVTPARWILGRVRVGGVLVSYKETNTNRAGNKTNSTATLGFALSEGVCEDIEKVWIDGNLLSFSWNGNVATVTGKYSGVVEMQKYFSGDGSLPSGILNSASFSGVAAWSGVAAGFRGNGLFAAIAAAAAAYKDALPGLAGINVADMDVPDEATLAVAAEKKVLEGVSYVGIKLTQPKYKKTQNRFWSSVPKIEFLVKGIKILYPGVSVPTWTENAAAVRYWWLRERRGMPASIISESDFRAAFQVCNVSLNVNLPSEFDSYSNALKNGIKYSINGVIKSEDSSERIEDEMDFAWQGYVVERNSLYHFRPGVDRPVADTINRTYSDSSVIEVEAVHPAPALQDRINVAHMQLNQSAAHDYLEYEVPEVADADAIVRDRRTLRGDLGERVFVTNPIAAAVILKTFLLRTRQNAVVSYKIVIPNIRAGLTTMPSDIVIANDSEYGFVNKKFMIQSLKYHTDGLISITLSEYNSNIYDMHDDLPALLPREIHLSDIRVDAQSPGNVTCDAKARMNNDGTIVRYIEVSWEQSDHETLISWREQGSADPWTDVFVQAGSNVDTPTTGIIDSALLADNLTFEISVTNFSEFGDQSDASTGACTVEGDLTPPGYVTNIKHVPIPGGFYLSWDNPRDADFSHVYIYVVEAEPPSSNYWYVGRATGEFFTVYKPDETTVKEWSVRFKAYDTSGNQGLFRSKSGVYNGLLITPDANDGLGFEWKGNWLAGQEYVKSPVIQDVVAHDGRTWVCLLTHTADNNSKPPSNATPNRWWGLLADSGQPGVKGDSFSWKGAWAAGTAYVVRDCVSAYGRSFISIQDNTASNANKPNNDGTDNAYWELLANKGDKGVDGKGWLFGSGVPNNNLGFDGDLYLRTSDYSVWGKAAGSWSKTADLSGADGSTWTSGDGAPSDGSGAVGDWYFRNDTAEIYKKGSNNKWVVVVDINGDAGTPGSQWLSGSGAPLADAGKIGDWYFRTSNGFVYEKTSLVQWTQRADITGPQGPKGPLGNKGDKGDKGNTGSTGGRGPQGLRGLRGYKGDDGPDGLRGGTGD